MRSVALALAFFGVIGLCSTSRADSKDLRASIRATQTFETGKQQGRSVAMYKHSFAGIRIGKLTAQQAMARVVKGKPVTLVPMETQRRLETIEGGAWEVEVDVQARKAVKVRSSGELARWATGVGLPFLSFQPEKQPAPAAAMPTINLRGVSLVRGLDLPPATSTKPLRVPMMIRGLY